MNDEALRDHLAGLAMQSLILTNALVQLVGDTLVVSADEGDEANPARNFTADPCVDPMPPHEVAIVAFEYAEHMLLARRAVQAAHATKEKTR